MKNFEECFNSPDFEVVPDSFRVDLNDKQPQRLLISLKVRRVHTLLFDHLIFFLVTSLGFTSFVGRQFYENAGEIRNPYDAVNVCLLCLLTNISFKTFLSQVIPQVSILTNIDIYIVGSLCVSVMQILVHALVILLDSE